MGRRAREILKAGACFAVLVTAGYAAAVSLVAIGINETYFGRPLPRDVAVVWLAAVIAVASGFGLVWYLYRALAPRA